MSVVIITVIPSIYPIPAANVWFRAIYVVPENEDVHDEAESSQQHHIKMLAEEHDGSCQRNHQRVDSQRVLQIYGCRPKSEPKKEHRHDSKEVNGTIAHDF